MRQAVATLLLAALATCAVAEPVSPFILASQETDTLWHYSGRASLRGHFIAAWEISEFDDSEKPEPYLVVRLKVAKSYMRLLPTLPRTPPSSIWLSNTDQALDVLLSKSLASRLKAHKIQRVEGDATVTVTSLGAEVSCDQWSFSAEVVTANIQPGLLARLGPDVTSSGGC
jgi:type IV pilus biogenesis protein CpaD/CtpE